MANLTVRATGVTFAPGYPRNLADLSPRCERGPVPAELFRDLDNGYDANAVSIRVQGSHVGWVPKELAATIAPEIDAGQTWGVEILSVPVDPDHPGRPGLSVRLFTKETARAHS